MRGGTVQINWHDVKPVLTLDFHPQSGLLATGGPDKDIKIFEITSVSPLDEEERMEVVEVKVEVLENQSIWNQMKEIVMFSGPATGLWICGPLMSLIDTVVIGQGSSLELAALGPGTVLCDYMSYTFMFLSIATSNMVAFRSPNRIKMKCNIRYLSCSLLVWPVA